MRIPGDFTDPDEASNIAAQDYLLNEPASRFSRLAQFRVEAAKAFHKAAASSRLRASVPAVPRVQHDDFPDGALTMFYRKLGNVLGKKYSGSQRWFRPARVIGRDKEGLVPSYHGMSILAAPHHLRYCTQRELTGWRWVHTEPELVSGVSRRPFIDLGDEQAPRPEDYPREESDDDEVDMERKMM